MTYYSETVAAEDRDTTMFVKLGARIMAFFDKVADAQNRSASVYRLQSLSDAELTEMGIKRENIVRYVYRDIYYV